MLYFPQLTSGAIAQYPLRRTASTRTLVNEMPDGSAVKMPDPDARACIWELRYSGLSNAERALLESFFLVAEGRLNAFTFVDPAGNALRWSDDLNSGVWRKDGMLSVNASDEARELARILRVTNAGQVMQGVEQTVAAPGRMVWCLSAFVRSGSPALVRCTLHNSNGTIESVWTAAPQWTQIWCSGSIPGDEAEIKARFEFEAGSTVEICALQLQPQPMPGSYRRTAGTSGVFASTRFDSDTIEFRANGVDDHAAVIHLRSRAGEY